MSEVRIPPAPLVRARPVQPQEVECSAALAKDVDSHRFIARLLLNTWSEMRVLSTLAGTELALNYSGLQIELGVGVAAAQRYFAECA